MPLQAPCRVSGDRPATPWLRRPMGVGPPSQRIVSPPHPLDGGTRASIDAPTLPSRAFRAQASARAHVATLDSARSPAPPVRRQLITICVLEPRIFAGRSSIVISVRRARARRAEAFSARDVPGPSSRALAARFPRDRRDVAPIRAVICFRSVRDEHTSPARGGVVHLEGYGRSSGIETSRNRLPLSRSRVAVRRATTRAAKDLVSPRRSSASLCSTRSSLTCMSSVISPSREKTSRRRLHEHSRAIALAS